MRLTDRDRYLLESVYTFRFLKSRDHILPLFDEKETILRRAQKLYTNGYLYRFERDNTYTQHLYGIGNKGADVLREWKPAFKIPRNDWPYHYKRLKDSYIAHELLIADVITSIEVTCKRREDVTFISQQEIFDRAPQATRERYYGITRSKVDDPHRIDAQIVWRDRIRDASIYSDWIFGLRFGPAGQKTERYFFLEADLDNEDVAPVKFEKASILKKMLVYKEASWAISRDEPTLTESLYGRRLRAVRTLFVTVPRLSPGHNRVQTFISTAQGITGGVPASQFLFGASDFLKTDDILSAPLLDAGGHRVPLIPTAPLLH